ncbi:hydrogen gas-evolving membrane-bound hydrogenase subunit E [Marispirochaeta sp.]|jgi:multicomponent Na+:H+ antiporter subunit B|uniref:hydrogen gas-evolving membrane-bound hydrogenase subunit E n=1 Tax=Marispirochaeta sp. TaxID=2038653 RepID=UPI0029C7DAD3|nr:hydrogen gas-evolving membrane-bound hydrogenase subunit E [Marispirochaeta sp.]
MKTKHWLIFAEVLVLSLTAVFLFISLHGEHPVSSGIRDYIVENGSEETGALNLVTAIYLGYRAFDTLGETIVLLLAVSGVIYFTDFSIGRKDHEEDDYS